MHRSPRLASALAALVVAAALAPMAILAPASAAGECGTHRSETDPPPTIRVLRTATGSVETVDFRTYLKNVLSREWISSWTTESLRSGAMAVRNYAWYQVIHWRGYTNAAGECFDIFDSTRDQHYDPARPTYPSMAAAVDATWGTLAHKGGRIFATYYNAGAAHEACGANANGWQMFQWGTQACGLAGMSAAQILGVYYPGVAVIAAPPPVAPPAATPSPTPMPPPAPTPAPAPSTPRALDRYSRRSRPRRRRPCRRLSHRPRRIRLRCRAAGRSAWSRLPHRRRQTRSRSSWPWPSRPMRRSSRWRPSVLRWPPRLASAWRTCATTPSFGSSRRSTTRLPGAPRRLLERHSGSRAGC